MADGFDLLGHFGHGALDEAGLVKVLGFVEVAGNDVVGGVDFAAAEAHILFGQTTQVLNGDVSEGVAPDGLLGYVGRYA